MIDNSGSLADTTTNCRTDDSQCEESQNGTVRPRLAATLIERTARLADRYSEPIRPGFIGKARGDEQQNVSLSLSLSLSRQQLGVGFFLSPSPSLPSNSMSLASVN